MLDQLTPAFAKLQALGWPKAVLSFAVNSRNGDPPALGLERKLMARMVEMKIGRDIDLYVL